MKNWSRLFLAAVFVPAAMWAESLTPEKVLDRRGLSEVRWSRDGTKVAFVVAEPMRGVDQNRDIWLYDETHDELRRLTTSDESDRSPRWSPDGRTLAFISDRTDPAQIHLLPMSGGEARALTNGKTGVTRFVWSPDGSAIAFLAPEPRSEEDEERNEDKDDARVVDKDDRPPQLWSVDVASGDVSALTTGINCLRHLVSRKPLRERVEPGHYAAKQIETMFFFAYTVSFAWIDHELGIDTVAPQPAVKLRALPDGIRPVILAAGD